MAYWKEWKSLIWGGIGLLVLGIFMAALYFIFPEDAAGNKGPASGFVTWGLLFLIVGIIMLILGCYLRKKPEGQ